MERILNIDEAKKRIEKRIMFYAEKIEAWEKVERVRRKNGENFSNLGKNFTNCEIVSEYSMDELTVYYRARYEGYTKDYINISGNQYQEPADTPEKIEERIKDLITMYKNYIERSRKALETIESTLKSIEPELDKLKEVIKKGAEETDTNYIIGSYIKNYLHILND